MSCIVCLKNIMEDVGWGDDGAVGKVLALKTQGSELDPRAHIKKPKHCRVIPTMGRLRQANPMHSSLTMQPSSTQVAGYWENLSPTQGEWHLQNDSSDCSLASIHVHIHTEPKHIETKCICPYIEVNVEVEVAALHR